MRHQLAPYYDAAIGEAHFLAHLHSHAPTRAHHGRHDELGADVALGKRLLVHS